jgi:hypothetical protein
VVAGTVGALVMAAGDVGRRGEQRAAPRNPLAEIGVEEEPVPLVSAQRTGTVPDPVGHADAPDVVHHAAERA